VEIKGTGGSPTATSIAPWVYVYDSFTRPQSITQTDGTYNRAQTFTYDSGTHLVSSSTTAFGTTTINLRDSAGRITKMTLPGSQVVWFAYDANGNRTLVRPPKGDGLTTYDHAFSSNAQNLLSLYQPPDPGFSPRDTSYSYDRDDLLTAVTTPSGSVTYAYDDAQRTTRRTTSHATIDYTYASTTGQLSSVQVQSGVGHAYTYAKDLLVEDKVTGIPHASPVA